MAQVHPAGQQFFFRNVMSLNLRLLLSIKKKPLCIWNETSPVIVNTTKMSQYQYIYSKLIPCGLCDNNNRCRGFIFSRILPNQRENTFIFPVLSLSLLAFPIVSVCSAALMTPGSWTLLLTSLWWASEDTQCSHQNGPDKEPFLPPSWQQLPWKDAHMPKHASSVQKSWFTHKPVGLKLSWNAKGIERNSKNARIRENAMDFLLLFEHYSGSHNKWCQLFLTW